MREIEWTEPALEDLAALDKSITGHMKRAVERFAETGAGNVKKLQGINPPEYRLRVGDWRIRFQVDNEAIRILRLRNRKEHTAERAARSVGIRTREPRVNTAERGYARHPCGSVLSVR